MHYSNFEIEDFITDDKFIAWCIEPTGELDHFWHSFLKAHPNRSKDILYCKSLVISIHSAESQKFTISQEGLIWNKIESRIESPRKRILSRKKRLTAILSVSAVMIAASILFANLFDFNRQKTNAGWIHQINYGQEIMKIKLPDGSQVDLEPFGSLKYPKSFLNEESRSVFLSGEAFFAIERDTLNPFLVYTNNTITKVLGTSFRINAFEKQEKVEVDVYSGKVAVYARIRENDKNIENIIVNADKPYSIPLPNKKIELVANQKVIYKKAKQTLIKEITDQPRKLKASWVNPNKTFVNSSCESIADELENIYGIQIIFVNPEIKKCKLTTSFSQSTLFEELEVIAAALDLNYEEVDGTIQLNGNRCN